MKAFKYGVGIVIAGILVVFVFGNMLSGGSKDIGLYVLIGILYLLGVLATYGYIVLEDKKNSQG